MIWNLIMDMTKAIVITDTGSLVNLGQNGYNYVRMTIV